MYNTIEIIINLRVKRLTINFFWWLINNSTSYYVMHSLL